MENFEEKDCSLFDTGRFNGIAMAYLVCALKDADIPAKEAAKIVNTFHQSMDNFPAKEALSRYRGEEA